MKAVPVFRFFFTPLEWILLLVLVLGVCGYVAYPFAIKYVAEQVCRNLYVELGTTKTHLFETQKKLENIKNKLSATQNALDKTKEQLQAAQTTIDTLTTNPSKPPHQSLVDEIEKLKTELKKTQDDLSKYQKQVYEWEDYCRKMLKYLDTINTPIEPRPSIPEYFRIELDRSK
ncbi:MAG: hypothetical protein LBE12_02200 [Planctomycetaceae bacterium]|jgi:5-bromo-4-chloroindolyl phosphate hydrolysis protein|nr:hypothetical protein [Planctomycetaceae bacterium]